MTSRDCSALHFFLCASEEINVSCLEHITIFCTRLYKGRELSAYVYYKLMNLSAVCGGSCTGGDGGCSGGDDGGSDGCGFSSECGGGTGSGGGGG
jgi:hypothetical protein